MYKTSNDTGKKLVLTFWVDKQSPNVCVCVCGGAHLLLQQFFLRRSWMCIFINASSHSVYTHTRSKRYFEREREIVLVLEMRNAFSQTYVFLFGGFWLVIFHVVGRSPFFFSLPFNVSRLIHTVVRTYTCVWVSKCVCRVYISITSIYNTSDCIRYIYKHTRTLYMVHMYLHTTRHTQHTRLALWCEFRKDSVAL